MVSSRYQTVLEQIPYLKEEELQKVYLLVGSQLKNNHATLTSEKEFDENEEELFLLYNAIKTDLDSRGVYTEGWKKFRHKKTFKSFREKFPIVEEFTAKHFGELKQLDRRRLYRIYARTLANWVIKNPYIPLSESMMLRHTHKIPDCMADSFPGYAASNMLHVVLGFSKDV